MKEKSSQGDHRPGQRYVRLVDRVNRRLVPVIGPPDLSPFTDVAEKDVVLCPVCGHPMSEHTIDHSTPNTVLNCPVAHIPQPPDDQPINEYGMPTQSAPAKSAEDEERQPRIH